TIYVTTALYSLALHDALPIFFVLFRGERQSILRRAWVVWKPGGLRRVRRFVRILIVFLKEFLPCAVPPFIICKRLDRFSCIYTRSEEHTSELQSRFDLVWRLL